MSFLHGRKSENWGMICNFVTSSRSIGQVSDSLPAPSSRESINLYEFLNRCYGLVERSGTYKDKVGLVLSSSESIRWKSPSWETFSVLKPREFSWQILMWTLISWFSQQMSGKSGFMKPAVSTIVALAQQQASELVNIREGITVLVGIQTTLGRLLRYSNRRWGTHLCDSYSLLKRWGSGKLSNGGRKFVGV